MSHAQTQAKFLGTVYKMRVAQKLFFETRSTDDLSTSKRLEKEVDNQLEELRGGQGRLFAEPIDGKYDA